MKICKVERTLAKWWWAMRLISKINYLEGVTSGCGQYKVDLLTT